jgi:P27 family predicted phage terminase small subunit
MAQVHRGRKSKAERQMLSLVRTDPSGKPATPIIDPSSPPPHLSAVMKSWWQEVAREFNHQRHELFVLKLAAEAFDQAEAARQFLAKNGCTYEDDNGIMRKRPEIAIEATARGFYLRAVRQLGLLRAGEKIKDPNANCTVGISWRQLEENQRRRWE